MIPLLVAAVSFKTSLLPQIKLILSCYFPTPLALLLRKHMNVSWLSHIENREFIDNQKHLTP
jgi:hypothetical protein